MEQLITADPNIVLGKPIVGGTRITVQHILERLGAGETVDDLLEAHPRLTQKGIQAALNYAVDVLSSDAGFCERGPRTIFEA